MHLPRGEVEAQPRAEARDDLARGSPASGPSTRTRSAASGRFGNRYSANRSGVTTCAAKRCSRCVAEVRLGRQHASSASDPRAAPRPGASLRSRRGGCGSAPRSCRTRPRRSGSSGGARGGRSGTSRASTGSGMRSRCRSRCRARPDTRSRAGCTAPSTLSATCSKANSGVWTPSTTSPRSRYVRSQAFTCGSVRRQLMHEYVQKSTRTTLPRSCSSVSGSLLIQCESPASSGAAPKSRRTTARLLPRRCRAAWSSLWARPLCSTFFWSASV